MTSLQGFIILAVLVCSSSALKCYICNSATDATCLMPNATLHLKDCQQDPDDQRNYTVCRKTTIDIESDPSKSRVIRNCGFEDSKQDCSTKNGFGSDQVICTCNTQGCNGANGLDVTLTSLAAIFLLQVLIRKLLV